MSNCPSVKITNLSVKDIRFPTSLNSHGSDAMHTDPDYSCAYVIIGTDNDNITGHGLTFTIGRGTEIVVQAVKSLSYLIVGQESGNIFNNFASVWRELTSESQMRWLGPEKGVMHLAVAAIVNALWDLWARIEQKPLWKLLVDMTPQQLVSTIDFRYITDVIKPEEAINMMEKMKSGKEERETQIRESGYPAYTTQAGWLGYSGDKVKQQCKDLMAEGFTGFKIKVGQDLKSDKERCKMVRDVIGPNNFMMVDANQRWEVNEAIDWMKELAHLKPMWIEEPTSPDDVLGHVTIAKALTPYGIGVACGEMCCNRVMFKQFLQAGGMNFCQIDSCRIGGVNEILSVYLMANKLGVPVCPHAGGVGLCEMVQHLQMFDYICVSGSMENRLIEHVAQEHDHFEEPAVVHKACYTAPLAPGYSTKLKDKVIADYEYPNGQVWQKLFEQGLFKKPQ